MWNSVIKVDDADGECKLGCPSPMSKPVKQLRKQLTQMLKPKTIKKRSAKGSRPTARRSRSGPAGPSPNMGRVGRGRLGLSDKPSGATSRRTQVIEEDEYIGELAGSTGFVTTSYAVNPGQASSFPWGNKIASLYEEYDYEFLEFYYKREVSEYATNGTTGKVMLSFDYDASDTAPTTKQQVEDTVPHMDGMPSDPVIRLKIDCARIRKNSSKYVRPGAQPANTDIKTYDAGNLFVSTYGNQSTGNLGELRVHYRVRLSEPVLEPSQVVGGVVHFSGTNGTTSNNFATSTLQTGGSPALTGITLGTNTIVFPAGIPGNYLIQTMIAGATSATAILVGSIGAASVLNLFTQGGTRNATEITESLAGTTTSAAMLSLAITVPTGGATITFTPSTITGAGSTDLFIVSLPSTVLTVVNGVESRLAQLERKLSRRVVFEEESDDDFKESPLSKSTGDLIAELQKRKVDVARLASPSQVPK